MKSWVTTTSLKDSFLRELLAILLTQQQVNSLPVWNGTCSFSLEGSYKLSYKSTINGYISKGRLSRLEGVSVKLFFIWVDIIDVKRNGDDLEFSVGIAGADFSVDNFEVCPQCGCGLNCDGENRKVSKIRSNLFVSSS
ncbi:hypothetical protein OIU77_003835 [Salix suchowensis]|uniref:DUF4283 domain-containing protein n=1 Tax=Salix suchowensis TaxID=1278906 RepID=A0ABQ9ATX0_9ROSI|nr:hypothetical protein OIU77_003835 [Salix suchowensis]